MTFGQRISAERKARGWSQKDLAHMVIKEDGTSISPQYLNDLERDRRNAPSDHLIKEFANVLEMSADYLFFLAGQVPEDLRDPNYSQQDVEHAFVAFRKALDN